MSQGQSHFIQTGMTPRAWRMLSYCCIGFLLYGFVLLSEALQNHHLNRIDQQLKQLEDQEMMQVEKSSAAAVPAQPS